MKIFIDSANVDEIREIASWGVLSGVTTNPSLVAGTGRDFKDILKEIVEIVDGSISAEAMADTWEGMVEDAKELAKISPKITVKLPTTPEGLKACRYLTDNKIVTTNMTLIFSVNQALLAARAGATYVSPFLGRTDDIGGDGVQMVREIKTIFDMDDEIKTLILAASPRNPKHAHDVALAGADIMTVPYSVFFKLIKHPLTDSGLKEFQDDWNKSVNSGKLL